jgi:AcrR family transcriptional regulator
MPSATYFALPEARRELLVQAAIAEFADHPYGAASLSRIARETGIAKGSFYQYFDDKLDLYRWLLCEEVPRQKRAFLVGAAQAGDFWSRLTHFVERGIAFLVEHPRLARLTATAADPAAHVDVRGLHAALCAAGDRELTDLLQGGIRSGALAAGWDARHAQVFVAAVLGPGLTQLILHELGSELHELLGDKSLKRRLGPRRRQALAELAVRFVREGLQAAPPRRAERKEGKP